MSAHKVCFTVFALLVFVIMISNPNQASESWQVWEYLRWSGLQQFSKGNTNAAQRALEQALAEAKRIQADSENEVISTYDLAQVFEAAGKSQQAEHYCKIALELSKRACASDSALPTLILNSLATLNSAEGKYDEVRKLEDEMDKRADASPEAGTIGVAKMEKDGTIKLDLRGEGSGMIGHASFSCPPSDPDYKKTLMHLGPLEPGGQKLVAPWK